MKGKVQNLGTTVRNCTANCRRQCHRHWAYRMAIYDTWEELSKGKEFLVAQVLSWVKNILLTVCSVMKVLCLSSGTNTGLMRPDFWKARALLELLGPTALMEDALLTALHPEVAPLAARLAGAGLVSTGDQERVRWLCASTLRTLIGLNCSAHQVLPPIHPLPMGQEPSLSPVPSGALPQLHNMLLGQVGNQLPTWVL